MYNFTNKQKEIFFTALKYNCDCDIRSYSGRFMYGKKCLGIVANSQKFLADIINGIAAKFDLYDDLDKSDRAELFSALLDYKTDSMGLSTIYYWPSIPYED